MRRHNDQAHERKKQHVKYIESEIKELIQQLDALKVTRNRLRKEICNHVPPGGNPQEEEAAVRTGTRKPSSIEVGARVIVNSNHKGRRGTIGTVISKRGTTQFIVRADEDGEEFSVWKNNLAHVRE